MNQKYIHVRGARVHNLKNVNVDIPRDQLVVITGLSGSGKSSLAFDTIYAEGQRRYVESLSAYARQFLSLMEKPDVDTIEGLSPAISIEQKTTSKNPRSTVGTITEIYDYMRLLWARVGIPYSPATGLPIQAQTVSQMVDIILAYPPQTRLYLLSPIVRGRKGEYRKEIQDLQKKGFLRVKIDGELYDIDAVPALDKNKKHTIEVVVDRLVISDDIAQRLAESIETALHLSEGLLVVDRINSEGKTEGSKVFSSKFACPESGFTLEEIEPRLFSFNNPYGACPICDGLGEKWYVDPDLVVPDQSLSLARGAIAPWSNSNSFYFEQTLQSLADHFKFDLHAPFKKLPDDIKHLILYGSGKTKIPLIFRDEKREYKTNKPFEGVINLLERRLKNTESNWVQEELGRYQSSQPCESCHGYRLKPEALCVKIADNNIGQVTRLAIGEADAWFAQLPQHLSEQQQKIASRILKEIQERLRFLMNVGLDYLTLDRMSGTLSGGESQRIRLASQIGSGLTGVLYVLDEPSIGLHQRDNDRLLETLKRLRDLGNTVLVVEHDEDTIRQADYIIDMGPRAGIHGGEVVASGDANELMKHKESLTAAYLSGRKQIPVPSQRRQKQKDQILSLTGVKTHNLKNVSVDFPLKTFTAITGVSGGGKSSLIVETLFKATLKELGQAHAHPGPYEELNGLHLIDKVIDIDQSPIGRTPRSNPATYTGMFSPIRDWFTGLPESKARGYKAGRFSFNVKGGRCEACEGDGVIKIEMHFLPDVYVTCDQCKGKRYNRETLEITYKGKSIADILKMTVEEALEFFHAVPTIRNKLEVLSEVGLGYIEVGQAATTLSGGEAQRIKLAKELSRRATGKTLYILDEPTTGLHNDDIRKLLEVLHKLVDQGNTVIVIEHNLEVIKTADWIIDLGPEGGHRGGEIVFAGTPEHIIKDKVSYTGKYLAPYLK